MSDKFKIHELFVLYKNWVINNPNAVTDVETVATWSSYFVAGKINNSPIISELVYSLSKLLSMFNDKLIKEAYGGGSHYFNGLQQQIKLWLTVIHYCEVFVELVVKKKWGLHGKWTAVSLLQLFKCSTALILLYRYKVIPIQHPPVPTLQRKKITDTKDNNETINNSFTLKRSGRVIRRVDGAPPVSLRDWQPLKTVDESIVQTPLVKDLMYAETLHIVKPIIHLLAMRLFSSKSWKQWLVSLSLDIASLKIYNRHMNDMPYEHRVEISRRKLGLILYLLRSPMYNGYSKTVIENTLASMSNKIPLMTFVCGPILLYLSHWQDLYFYMWSS